MQTRRILALCTASALLCFANPARAIDPGQDELRPSIGAIARITGQPSQFALGLDWAHTLTKPLAFVLGSWVGVAQDWVGLELHLGVKYRFIQMHPRVAPVLLGGVGLTAGFTSFGQSLLGLGFRMGTGVDFAATRRVIPGLQIVFDVGPRFTPTVGPLATVQVTFGCGFIL